MKHDGNHQLTIVFQDLLTGSYSLTAVRSRPTGLTGGASEPPNTRIDCRTDDHTTLASVRLVALVAVSCISKLLAVGL